MTTDEALTGIVDLPVDPGGLPAPHPSGRVGTWVVADTDLPRLRGSTVPLTAVVSGGAGQVAGPAGLATRLSLPLVALEISLRDLDDLSGNARRVVAAVDDARASGALDEEVAVYVGLPLPGRSAGWLAAADEVAAADLRLGFGAGTPGELAGAIDAALDRETPFRVTTACDPVAVLVATRRAFDGAGPDEVAEVLARGAADAEDLPPSGELVGARRWFVSGRASGAEGH